MKKQEQLDEGCISCGVFLEENHKKDCVILKYKNKIQNHAFELAALTIEEESIKLAKIIRNLKK